MPDPLVYFDRYQQRLETEAIYGDAFLRWAYENPLGRATTWLLVKRAIFSHWYGWRMNRPASAAKIPPFLEKFGIDTTEMADDPARFANFNAFFSRRLKPSARPIAGVDDQTVVFPADGRQLVIPNLAERSDIYVKGIPFDVAALLGDASLAERYRQGSALISRLCPVDYHRYHFPIGGMAGAPRLINGPLYSVNPIALRRRPTLLWENKRYLTLLETQTVGQVLLLEIGATCVGTVVHTSQPGSSVKKGDEKGYFLFGGSCFMTLFEPGRVKFDEDLVTHSAEGREVYARMGDHCAQAVL